MGYGDSNMLLYLDVKSACVELISVGKEGVGYVKLEDTVGCGPNKTPVTEKMKPWAPVICETTFIKNTGLHSNTHPTSATFNRLLKNTVEHLLGFSMVHTSMAVTSCIQDQILCLLKELYK